MKGIDKNMNMTIGQLADQTNTEAQTIRFYEKQGLLEKPERTDSNYRLYRSGAISRLQFIKRAKEIGFSLTDIKILFGMVDGKMRKCSEVQEFAETRLSKIRSQIADLTLMEKAILELVNQCSTSDNISECPILETLTGDIN